MSCFYVCPWSISVCPARWGALMALQDYYPFHLGIDNLNVARTIGRLLDHGSLPKPLPLVRMWRRYMLTVLPSRNNQPSDIWISQGISGNVLVNPRASSSSPSNVTEDTSPHVTSERQNPATVLNPRFQQDRQLEIHSTLRREDSQRILVQTNNDSRFQIFISTNSLLEQHLLVGR